MLELYIFCRRVNTAHHVDLLRWRCFYGRMNVQRTGRLLPTDAMEQVFDSPHMEGAYSRRSLSRAADVRTRTNIYLLVLDILARRTNRNLLLCYDVKV